MRYEEIPTIDFPAAEAQIASGVPAQIADALLRASLSSIDPGWVEATSRRFLVHSDLEVQWAALNALGHIARRYKQANVAALIAAVAPLQAHPALAGKVRDLLDDIETYVQGMPQGSG